MTLDCIIFRDKWLNQNYKRDYGIIFINILLLPARRLGKVAAVN
jgi:hypothetical protein